MRGLPSFLRRKASVPPSGDQVGEVEGSVAKVTCRGSPPATGATQICVVTVQPAFWSAADGLPGSNSGEGFAVGSSRFVRTV